MNEIYSNCCNSGMFGHPSNLTMIGSGAIEGRCDDCKEMTSFTTGIFVEYINSTFPLGTTDGQTYTIVPVR